MMDHLPKKARLYVDMDGVLADIKSALAQLDESLIEQYDPYPVDVPGLYSHDAAHQRVTSMCATYPVDVPGLYSHDSMKPIPGAVAAYTELSGLFDTCILSTAPWNNPTAWIDKLEWVHHHFGANGDGVAYKRLILSHHKDLMRGTYIIDDGTGHGVERFDGKHIHFGTEAFPDWDAVLAYLRPRAW